jgi:MarR family transcriptional regulator, 2-MHQ and catechol-resistance regulon repressor
MGSKKPNPAGSKLDSQVVRFHHEMVELIKKYQFRDRNQMTCCGVSVSQCYVLEGLHRFGPQTMNELAGRMYLSVSTLTRVVDQIVAKGYATRKEDERDRRVRRVQLTGKGKGVYQKAWTGIFGSEKTILSSFPTDRRERVVDLLRKLNQAVDGWRSCCSGKGKGRAA